MANLKTQLLMCSIPDLGYSIIFLALFLFLKHKSSKITKESDEVDIVPSGYSILVSGFPSSVHHE